MKFFKLAVNFLFMLLMLTSCSKDDPRYILPGGDDTSAKSVLTIVPSNSTLNKGTTLKYTAILVSAEGEQTDVTLSDTNWSVADETIAAIDTDARLTGLKLGTTTVHATYGEYTTQTNINVTDKAISLLSVTPPVSLSIVGLTTQFHAEVIYDDGTTQDITADATWSASDTKATVDAAGLVKAIADGNVTIKAVFSGEEDNATLGILSAVVQALEIKPFTVTLPINAMQLYSATLILEDNNTIDVSHDVDWASTSGEISSITSDGLLTAHKEGSNEIYALLSYGDNYLFNSAKVSVLAATLESIDITPKALSVAVGVYGNYIAVGSYSDGSIRDISHEVAWASSDTTIASIDTNSLAVSHSPGIVDISAVLEGMSASTSLTVTSATLSKLYIFPSSEALPAHLQYQYSAFGEYSDHSVVELTEVVSWSVDEDSGKASFDPLKKGLLTTLSSGLVHPLVSYDSQTAEANLTIYTPDLVYMNISPESSRVPVGTYGSMTAIATYRLSSGELAHIDVTRQCQWSSTLPEKVGIDDDGLARALEVTDFEDAIIKARYQGSTYSATVDVTAEVFTALQVTPANIKMPKTTTQLFTATAYFSEGSTSDVTNQVSWNSDDSNIVSIVSLGEDAGRAIAENVGETTVSATLYALTSNKATVVVSDATLQGIAIVPATKRSIPNGLSYQYRAEGSYTDGSVKDITSLVLWHSSAPDVATVDTVDSLNGASGLAHTHMIGDTVISISYSTYDDEVPLEVTDETIFTLEITPTELNVTVGKRGVFTATAIYSKGYRANVTNQAHWTSTDPDSFFVSTYGKNAGTYVAEKVGTAKVTAEFYAEDSNEVNTIVSTAAILSNIQITPNNETYNIGDNVPYAVWVVYDDFTTEDVTEYAPIQSTDFTVATFDSSNYMTAVGEGDIQLTAYYSGMLSETENLHVRGPDLDYIEIIPNEATVVLDAQGQLKAFAHNSDGSVEDITNSAVWSSDNVPVLDVNSSGWAAASDSQYGHATVTISKGGLTATSEIDVLDKEIDNIQIIPNNISVTLHDETTYSVVAIYKDLSSSDITAFAELESLDTSVAVVSEGGVVVAVGIGSSELKATYFGFISEKEFIHVNP